MSSSTLRRKLKSEGNSIQDIRNRVRLGHGLHLIQTTNNSIGNIAFECGYQSQSRFTEQFKICLELPHVNYVKPKCSLRANLWQICV